MPHYIRVYTVCKGNKISSDKINIFVEFYNLTSLDMYMDYGKLVVLHLKE